MPERRIDGVYVVYDFPAIDGEIEQYLGEVQQEHPDRDIAFMSLHAETDISVEAKYKIAPITICEQVQRGV